MREATPELDGKILGINDRSYPNETYYGQSYVVVRVVLVAGAVGDYAAYIGVGSAEFVKRFGNKLSFEEACCHFPGGQLEKERYRL
jgi:hypothetical protein